MMQDEPIADEDPDRFLSSPVDVADGRFRCGPVIPVSLQIVSRYTALIPSYIWTEEMSRFLFIWMVMLGAMVGIREGTHFEVDIWPELGQRANAALRIVSHLFVLVFAL